ncbi:DNA repair and recombination protein PIF1, partial [Termitomyces sp. J132]
VCSYVGIAARNVAGIMLHSALNLMGRSSHSTSATADFMSLWDSVDLMFIDEVSVLSCQFLRQISCALSVAKGNPSAFGGMNVIFAGDFAQLPPPADARLYGGIDGEKCSKSNVGQDIIFRKLLWFSVQTVVFLTQ